MIDELIESASQHGQRSGQFLSNAIADYLQAQNRTCDDHDIGNSLFYLGDEDLEKILQTYTGVLNARRNGAGFGGEKKEVKG